MVWKSQLSDSETSHLFAANGVYSHAAETKVEESKEGIEGMDIIIIMGV